MNSLKIRLRYIVSTFVYSRLHFDHGVQHHKMIQKVLHCLFAKLNWWRICKTKGIKKSIKMCNNSDFLYSSILNLICFFQVSQFFSLQMNEILIKNHFLIDYAITPVFFSFLSKMLVYYSGKIFQIKNLKHVLPTFSEHAVDYYC